MSQHYLAELTALICDFYETRISEVAWKKFRKDYEKEFELPFPYLEENHTRFVAYLEEWVIYREMKKVGRYYDEGEEKNLMTHLVKDHPDFAELKAHNYV